MKIKTSDLQRGDEVDMPIENQGKDNQKQRSIRYNKSTKRYELFTIYDYAHPEQKGQADYSYSDLKDLIRNTNRMFHTNDVAVEDVKEERLESVKERIERLSEQGKTSQAKGVTEADVDAEQLKQGIKVELEHTDNEETAKKIALDHLAEFPDYYTRLKKMEDEAKKKVSSRIESLRESFKEVSELGKYVASDIQDAIDSLTDFKIKITKNMSKEELIAFLKSHGATDSNQKQILGQLKSVYSGWGN